MKYDFETIAPCLPGNLKRQWTPEAAERAGFVSFEAAEMDFATAPSIVRSLTELVQNGNFGFNMPTDEYRERICWWMRRVRDWKIAPEWIVPVMGTIFSVATTIRMVLEPGDRIIVPSPGYNRYAQAARRMDLETVTSPMQEKDGRYEIDFADLERCMADPKNKLLILCNPHNPTGRVWTRAELKEIARLSAKYGVYVYSDEIFAEVVFDGRRTIPYCEIDEGRAYAIVCTSLGKTFNFTGVNHANVIIPDEKLRERFVRQRTADHYGSLEPFAYASVMGAYTEEGLDWVQEMLAVVERNRNALAAAFSIGEASEIQTDAFPEKKLPKTWIGTSEKKMLPGELFAVEGTYVGWIKWNTPDLKGEALKRFLDEEALVPLELGTEFGEGYDSYTRMNLASTNRQMCMALERLQGAFESNCSDFARCV
jgi:cystathionine beta-lyase